MKTFEFNLKHDGGEVTIRTTGNDVQSAKEAVCKAENAPLSSVQWWRVVPTANQIRKTKSLLRGI